MASERTAIQLPPGVVQRGSEAEMAGHWRETQLVRWVENVMRPIAGWERIIFEGVTATASPIRAMHAWTDNDGVLRVALLCDAHLYILETNQLIDISPVPAMATPSNAELGGYGDWYYDVDRHETVTWPTDGYGTPRPIRPERKLVGPAYSLDNWGEDLVAMTSTDGRLLRWKPSDPIGSKAAAVPGAPLANRTFVVTPERHLMLFQMGGIFNRFGWCDQEDIENWEFTDITSMAGFYDIQPAGPLISAKATRFGTIMFMPGAMYHSRYLGIPYVYSIDYLGKYAAPLTQAAIVQTADLVIWPALDAFWAFNGSSVQPLDCDLLDWLQRNMNQRYATVRVSGMFLGAQTECWWFFPSGEATENDRYVIYNFQENWWAMGQLPRTCGVTGTGLHYPLMSDGASVFRHEYGLHYYDAPVLPYAQSNAVNIAKGARQVTVTRGIVDTRAPAGDVMFYVGTRLNRITDGVPGPRLKGPYPVREDGKIDLRVTGRDLVFRIESQKSGVQPWTFGQMLVQLNPRGQR